MLFLNSREYRKWGTLMSKGRQKFLLILYVISLSIMLIGATYAYFTIIKISTIIPESTIKSATTEILYFFVGDDINISASDENFKSGMSSLSSSSYATAKLEKGEAEVKMKHKYNIYFNIMDNDFVYAVGSRNPELLLSITGPDGEVTEIDNLNYKTIVDNKGITHKGFDITTKTGKFTIASEYLIETEDEITQDWNIKVTLINLDHNQDVNKGKTFSGQAVIEKVI